LPTLEPHHSLHTKNSNTGHNPTTFKLRLLLDPLPTLLGVRRRNQVVASFSSVAMSSDRRRGYVFALQVTPTQTGHARPGVGELACDEVEKTGSRREPRLGHRQPKRCPPSLGLHLRKAPLQIDLGWQPYSEPTSHDEHPTWIQAVPPSRLCPVDRNDPVSRVCEVRHIGELPCGRLLGVWEI